MMNRRMFPFVAVARYQYILLAIAVSTPGLAAADPPNLLKMFQRTWKVSVDESKIFELREEDGPFLILASTLVGEGAKERANNLAIELRKTLDLPAYIYKEEFDFTQTVRHDARRARKAKFANPYSYEAYAVLVGEYTSIDHPNVDRDLKRIKSAMPASLVSQDAIEAENSAKTPVTAVRAIANGLKQKFSKDETVGPMAHAFATRNPLLPEVYYQAPTVDSFVRQLNEERSTFNLLEADGKYTVVVKTFRGLKTIVDGRKERNFLPSSRRLDRNALMAEKMVKKLRDDGIEAYQFHNRESSLVTIGTFAELGTELPGGGFRYNPQIERIMKDFNAFSVDPRLARQVPRGANGHAANNVGLIPFDVRPTPIAIPKPEKRSLYGSNLPFGRR